MGNAATKTTSSNIIAATRRGVHIHPVNALILKCHDLQLPESDDRGRGRVIPCIGNPGLPRRIAIFGEKHDMFRI